MKKHVSFFLLAAVVFSSCSRSNPGGYEFPNCAYLDVSATSSTQLVTFSNNLPEVNRELCVSLAYPADKDVTATVAVDEGLVASYNTANGTSYPMLPKQYRAFTSTEVTIPAGKTLSSSIVISLTGLMGEGKEETGALAIDETYLFPVRLSSTDMDILAGSAVAYYLIRRSSAITVAAELHDNWINFPLLDEPGEIADAYNGLTAVTYEALIYVDEFRLSKPDGSGNVNISSVMGVEQYLLMRIGDVNFQRQQIQFDGSGSGSQFGKFPKSDEGKILYTGRWYHVACTYDQTTRTVRIYVDGKMQSEEKNVGIENPGENNRINLAMRALGMSEAYQFFIAKSYDNDRPLQGKIAEVRVWSVARTPDEIWANMYRIQNPEEEPGLIGYWKFNEGVGNVVKDYSKYGNDGISEFDIVWPTGIEIQEINK